MKKFQTLSQRRLQASLAQKKVRLKDCKSPKIGKRPLHLMSKNKCTANLTSLTLAQKNLNYPMIGKLSPDNRWVIMAELIPWSDFEAEYAENFSANFGAERQTVKRWL